MAVAEAGEADVSFAVVAGIVSVLPVTTVAGELVDVKKPGMMSSGGSARNADEGETTGESPKGCGPTAAGEGGGSGIALSGVMTEMAEQGPCVVEEVVEVTDEEDDDVDSDDAANQEGRWSAPCVWGLGAAASIHEDEADLAGEVDPADVDVVVDVAKDAEEDDDAGP